MNRRIKVEVIVGIVRGKRTLYFSLTPNWICEVLSPSTAQIDRVDKMPLYLSAGVTGVWLVDPNMQILEVYIAQHQQWLSHSTYKNVAAVSVPPFAAICLDLAALWA